MERELSKYELHDIDNILEGNYDAQTSVDTIYRCLGIDTLEEEVNSLKSELKQLKQCKSTCVDEELGELRRSLIIKVTEIINNSKSDYDEMLFAKYMAEVLFKYPHKAKELF